MAEEREKKRKKSASGGEPTPSSTRVQDGKAGDILRQARIEKGLELEEVSSAIHVRVAQLRAIEDGHIESLPGMTYAQGFVKSYAQFLKLDTVSIVASFKAEHSGAPAKPDLKFPEPIPEGKMPDPIMIGAAVVFALVLLIGWVMFSGGGSDKTNVAVTQIPLPPPGDAGPIVPVAPAVPVVAATQGMVGTNILDAVPPAAATAAPVDQTVAQTAPVETLPEGSLMMPQPKPTADQQAAAKADAQAAAPAILWNQPASSATAPQDNVINVRKGKSRITLQANKASWVQITNSKHEVILKRVLRPGDKYFVPDEPGLTMVTSNAGGLDVTVDGQQGKTIGKQGEIVRGVGLDPSEMRGQRQRVKFND